LVPLVEPAAKAVVGAAASAEFIGSS